MASVRRRLLNLACMLGVTALGACGKSGDAVPSPGERAAIADTLGRMVDAAWDLSRGDVVSRLMGLYPVTGSVTSAAGGRVTTSRDSLRSQIETFWHFVGQNMGNPRFERVYTHVDVLSRDAAVLTTTYHIPHLQPDGMPHDIAGAMTLLFQRTNGKWGVIAEHLSDAPASSRKEKQ
ncbi:MAG: hypothetical protein ABJD07_08530 [Gemmatimonadaceae bacterium]